MVKYKTDGDVKMWVSLLLPTIQDLVLLHGYEFKSIVDQFGPQFCPGRHKMADFELKQNIHDVDEISKW